MPSSDNPTQQLLRVISSIFGLENVTQLINNNGTNWNDFMNLQNIHTDKDISYILLGLLVCLSVVLIVKLLLNLQSVASQCCNVRRGGV